MDVPSLLSAFTKLRQAWALNPRAQGGAAALAGFDFQLGKALLELIRASDEGRPFVFVEAVSDLVLADNGFVIAQAKRTLSSGSIISALDELWEIESLIPTATPELMGKVRYEIHSAQRAIANAQGTLDRWTPDGVLASDAKLEAFKSRVSFEVSPAPRLEAARLLLERYKDPAALNNVSRYLGRLLSAASSGTFDEVVREIVQELDELRTGAQTRERRLGLWGAEDRAPDVVLETDPARAIRVGERLTPHDLRQGRLAWRKAYAPLHAAVESTLEGAGQGGRLPTVWIEGRSGAGKSAALLHVTARTFAEDPQRVILWLGPHADWLGAAVRWAADLVREGRQVILALDDPCSAERQHPFASGVQEAYEEWQALLAAGPMPGGEELRPPLLLCCGPVEQRQSAEALGATELEFTPLLLPRETAEDLEELAAWYRLRTGREPMAYSGDVLLVQRFFEWNKGRLEAFAERFRSRLQDFDQRRTGEPVLSLVASILALGRLYAEFPAAALRAAFSDDPATEAAFLQLSREEEHFSFEPSGDAGVRLTHPHLAAAIYREWYGRPRDAPHRREHLRRGLETACGLAEPDPSLRTAPLWAMLRLAEVGGSSDSELRERLDLVRDELVEVLAQIYPKVLARGTQLTDLPVWVGLDRALQLGLSPPPLALLRDQVAAASQPARGLRLSAHILLQHASRSGDLTAAAAVATMLTRLVDWREGATPWPEWSWIAIDHVKRYGADALRGALVRLIERSSDWTPTGYVMEAVARADPAAEDFALVAAWLRSSSPRQGPWPAVLLLYLSARPQDETVDDLVLRFLEARPEYPLWPAVWRTQLDRAGQDRAVLLPMGLSWVGQNASDRSFWSPLNRENAGFDRVWTGLWAGLPAERSQLRSLGEDWLVTTSPANLGWSRVWQALWSDAVEEGRDRARLVELALSWLRGPGTDLGWSYVWEILAKAADPSLRTELSTIGRAWLEAKNQEHQGWGFVWELEYLGAASDPDAQARLVALAESWLSDPQASRNGWAHQWKLLGELNALPATQLHALALAWLEVSGESGSWSQVYCDLQDCDDPRLEGWGLRRLQDIDSAGWSYVFRSWAERSRDPETIGDLALRWLSARRGSDRGWGHVWCEATDRVTDADVRRRLAVAGSEWLQANLQAKSWPEVWRRVMQMAGGEAASSFRELALTWLLQTQPVGRAWGRVWYAAVTGRTAIPQDLTDRARAWLERGHAAYDTWMMVRRRLEELVPSFVEAQALQPALDALLQKPGQPRDWFGLWRLRIDLQPPWSEDPALLDATVQWAFSVQPKQIGNLLAFVVAKLLPVAQTRDGAWKAALRWLASSSGSETGDVLWAILARNRRTEAEAASLSDLAEHQIADVRPASPAWARLMRRLGGLRGEQRARLVARAADKLLQETASDGWAMAFVAWSEGAPAPLILQTALSWLAATPADTPGWMLVWSTARQGAEAQTHAQLHQVLRQSLAQGVAPTLGSFDIWRYQTRPNPPPGVVLALAEAWLARAAPTWPQWIATWRLLLRWDRLRLTEPTLVAAQDQWLLAQTDDADWVAVFRLRLSQLPTLLAAPDLREAATRWLEKAPGVSRDWSFVAEPAVAAANRAPADLELLAITEAWLEDHTGHNGWPFVWSALWRHSARSPELRAAAAKQGRRWLASAARDAPGRGRVQDRVRRA